MRYQSVLRVIPLMIPRRDTLARWNQFDPVPAENELCLAYDKAKFKIGDGVHTWKELPWFKGSKIDPWNK
jgi:hypothetical protein